MLNAAAPGTPAAALGSQGGTLTPGGALINGVPSAGSGNLGSSGNLGFSVAAIAATARATAAEEPGSNSGFSTNTGQRLGSQSNPGETHGSSGGSDQGNSGFTSGSDQSSSNPGSSLGNSTQSGFGNSQPGPSNARAVALRPEHDRRQSAIGGARLSALPIWTRKRRSALQQEEDLQRVGVDYNPMMDVAQHSIARSLPTNDYRRNARWNAAAS